MSAEILRLPAVCGRVGLSKSSIYQKIKEGDFPSPVRLGERAIGFLVADIERWIETRERVTREARP
jgi:prophage regulatory protein